MRAGDRAWIALGVGVVAWNFTCSDGETLSECVDSYIERHPLLTRLLIATVATHLANSLSPKVDIIHLGFVELRRAAPCLKNVVLKSAVARCETKPDDCATSTT